MHRTGSRRRFCLGLAASVGLPLSASLGGCGFQPVYMPTASGKPGVAQRELNAVFVRIIPERPGQVLREALQEQFGDDSGTPANYDLQVSFQISGEGIAITANDIATRIRMAALASYVLHAHDSAQTVLTSGTARARDGINVFDEQYFAADLETEAVQRRLAEAVARQITMQLAIWFRHRATAAG